MRFPNILTRCFHNGNDFPKKAAKEYWSTKISLVLVGATRTLLRVEFCKILV